MGSEWARQEDDEWGGEADTDARMMILRRRASNQEYNLEIFHYFFNPTNSSFQGYNNNNDNQN